MSVPFPPIAFGEWKVVTIHRRAGELLKKDELVVTLDAKVMEEIEVEVLAPTAGVIETIDISIGDIIGSGDILFRINKKLD